jgi:hypothetical protein
MNTLADCFAGKENCQERYKVWSYRSQLLEQEILTRDPDIGTQEIGLFDLQFACKKWTTTKTSSSPFFRILASTPCGQREAKQMDS